MSRSKWKGLFLHPSIIKKSLQFSARKNKIWSRTSVIPSSFIGKNFLVHNGKEFKTIFINREKVGFKFGEFSFTRKRTNQKKVPLKIIRKKK